MVTPADSLPPAPTHRLARQIRVVRTARDPATRVYIDGELLPYIMVGDDVSVRTPHGAPGVVTLSLTAESVLVEDRYLDGAGDALGLDHTHE